jgi:predicted alpha/beta superfamily hydrolase
MIESMHVGEHHSIHSWVLNEERNLVIKLPNDFDPEWEYPVLYMLDADYSRFYHHDIATIQYLTALERLPEMLIVGITNTDRNRDTLPVEIENRPGSGGAAKFIEFIVSELQPFIATNFTTTKPRYLYGASNAGIFTLYTLLTTPNAFDAFLAISPMIGYCPELVKDHSKELFKRTDIDKKFLYMNYGKTDLVHVTEHVPWYEKLLEREAPKWLTWESRYHPDEGHVPYTSIYNALQAAYRILVLNV